MEKNEVSRQEIEVFRVLLGSQAWMSNREIASACKDVADRTVRAMTLKFVQLGLVEQAEVFPGHRYRVCPKANKRNRGYVDRLKHAADVFGVALD